MLVLQNYEWNWKTSGEIDKKNKKLTNNTWSEKVDITTDTAHIEKIIIGYMPMYENKY